MHNTDGEREIFQTKTAQRIIDPKIIEESAVTPDIQAFAHKLKELPKFEEGLPTSDTDFIAEGLEYDYLRICDLLGFHTITRPLLTFEKEEFLTAVFEFGYNPPLFSGWR